MELDFNQKTMRQKGFALFFSVLMMAACTHRLSEEKEQVTNEGKAIISIGGEDFAPVAKGSINAEFIPDINDLKIEIFKNPGKEQVRLYRDTYANTRKQQAINLNCADYRILASYGDSLGVGFDPQKIYYSGVYDFTLEPSEVEEAEVLVSPSNVRASVVFGDSLKMDFSNFYAKVRSQTNGGKVRSLRYDYDETRGGFVPAGKLRVELYVKVDDHELYCPGPDMDVAGGTDLTFNVETVRQESEVFFDVTVSFPDRKDTSYTIPAFMLPKDSPEINLNNLRQDAYVMEPGDEPYDNLRMDIKADGMIEHCWLNIESAYLAERGVPQRLDLAAEDLGLGDMTAAEDVADALNGVGLKWMSSMKGCRLAYVDFTGVTEFMSSTPNTPLFEADFSVELIDARQNDPGTEHVGRLMTDTYSFRQVIPAPAILLVGFDYTEDEKIVVLEGQGVNYNGMMVAIQAKGGIAHCWLDVDSPYLKAAGVTESRIDLANIDEDGTVASTLRSFGLSWPEDLSQRTDAIIYFNGIANYMDRNWYDGKNLKFADMSISVENVHYGSESEKVAESKVADFEYLVPTVKVNKDISAGNVWAKKILDFSADCALGDASSLELPADQFKLQYKSSDEWIDIPGTSYSYPTRSCSMFAAEPSTQYHVRAIYHDNPNLAAEFTTSVTEAELQIEGGTFNQWEVMTHNYYTEKIFNFGDEYLSRDYYLPEPQSWWAVNSKKTMPDVTTPNFVIKLGSINYDTGETQTYKVFPTVTKYNVDLATRNYAAQIVTMHVCNMATAGNDGTGTLGAVGALISVNRTSAIAAGEICLGTSDASGNLSYGGHEFASRPSKVTVRYQYDSENSEKGYMKLFAKRTATALKYLFCLA